MVRRHHLSTGCPLSGGNETCRVQTLANVLVKPNCPSFAWPGNPITGIACTADGQHFAANLLNDCVYLLDVADLPGHSERQAATRPAPGRRRRRREAAEYSAGRLQELPQCILHWGSDKGERDWATMSRLPLQAAVELGSAEEAGSW